MSVDHEELSVVLLEITGIVGIIGGIAPMARTQVSVGWFALLPLGLLSIVLAVRRLASMNGPSHFVMERIDTLRAGNTTYRGIADALNDDGVPTGQGGAKWWPATVKKVLERAS